jgi:hypothetical protein
MMLQVLLELVGEMEAEALQMSDAHPAELRALAGVLQGREKPKLSRNNIKCIKQTYVELNEVEHDTCLLLVPCLSILNASILSNCMI